MPSIGTATSTSTATAVSLHAFKPMPMSDVLIIIIVLAGTDRCDVAFNTFKCYYEQDPDVS